MDQRLLIYFPPHLLERAKGEISSPESGLDNLNQLVVEALTQYLDALDSAGAGGQASPGASESRTGLGGLQRWSTAAHDSGPADLRRLWQDSLQTLPATTLTEVRPSEGQAPSPELRARDTLLDEQLTEPEEAMEQGLIPIEELNAPLRIVFERESSRARELSTHLEALVLQDRGRLSGERIEMGIEVRQAILAQTEITPVDVETVPVGEDVAEPDRDQPLFGLHNRDYPSVWALRLLAEATLDGPVLWSEFASGLELTARELGNALRLLDRLRIPGESPRTGLKYSTAFPNPKKSRKGTGQVIATDRDGRKVRLHPFVKNNVARIQGGGRAGDGPEARGPLARWGAVAFRPAGRDYSLGVTSAGSELLRRLTGLSLELPHSADHAEGFLGFLADYSSGDAEGFLRVLQAIGESSPDRDELVRTNKQYFDRFLEKPAREDDFRYAGTMTQGYVARGREWGLIRPDQGLAEDGKRRLYEVTTFGYDAIALLTQRVSDSERPDAKEPLNFSNVD